MSARQFSAVYECKEVPISTREARRAALRQLKKDAKHDPQAAKLLAALSHKEDKR